MDLGGWCRLAYCPDPEVHPHKPLSVIVQRLIDARTAGRGSRPLRGLRYRPPAVPRVPELRSPSRRSGGARSRRYAGRWRSDGSGSAAVPSLIRPRRGRQPGQKDEAARPAGVRTVAGVTSWVRAPLAAAVAVALAAVIAIGWPMTAGQRMWSLLLAATAGATLAAVRRWPATVLLVQAVLLPVTDRLSPVMVPVSALLLAVALGVLEYRLGTLATVAGRRSPTPPPSSTSWRPAGGLLALPQGLVRLVAIAGAVAAPVAFGRARRRGRFRRAHRRGRDRPSRARRVAGPAGRAARSGRHRRASVAHRSGGGDRRRRGSGCVPPGARSRSMWTPASPTGRCCWSGDRRPRCVGGADQRAQTRRARYREPGHRHRHRPGHTTGAGHERPSATAPADPSFVGSRAGRDAGTGRAARRPVDGRADRECRLVGNRGAAGRGGAMIRALVVDDQGLVRAGSAYCWRP